MPAPPQPPDPDFERRVRDSFARQGLMSTYRAVLDRVEPGLVEIGVPFAPGLTQQDGLFHAGVVIAAVDSACGYAALTLMAPGKRVLTVELKVNLLAPAAGPHLTARGEVLRPGRTLTVCRGDAYGASNGSPKHVATVLTTMAASPTRPDPATHAPRLCDTRRGIVKEGPRLINDRLSTSLVPRRGQQRRARY